MQARNPLHRYGTAAVALLLFVLPGCNIHDAPDQGDYFTALLEYPREHPGGLRETPFEGTGRLWIKDNALFVEARSGRQVIQLVLHSYTGKEGVFYLGTAGDYGAFGEVDPSCREVSAEAAPPCRLAHTSRHNFGTLMIRRHRQDSISASFSFRAHDPATPATAFNVTNGAFLVSY